MTTIEDTQAIARILSEALPYMQRYDGQTVVVKYGGHAMVDPELARKFARDVVQLKLSGINPIVVHGGGPQIGAILKRMNVESRFDDGLRVTDEATMQVVEMVLAGSVNKAIVASIQAAGGKAIGISGKDGTLCVAKKLERTRKNAETGADEPVDLGFVGEPATINPEILHTIIRSEAVPVIAPTGVSRDGETFNINADTFAGAIAVAMKAKRLLLLTDVSGVMDKDGELLPELSLEDIERLKAEGTISGGMIPKLESCAAVVRGGVEGVVITDGRVPHCVLLELLTPHGVGTRISERRTAAK
jgi:acetylglutamate kinase